MSEILDTYEVDGQMSIYDLFENPEDTNPLIAVSKVFAKAVKQMNLTEWKTFVFALTQIKWMEQNKHFVRLDKKRLAELVGIEADEAHLSGDLKRAIGKLPTHSFLEMQHEDGWVSGCFINQVACYKNIVRISFTESYMPLFEELNKEKNYITLWAEDLFQMRSERSILFYEDLRLHSDTRKNSNSRIYSTKELKQMFNIPKDGKGAYMKKDGHFNRTEFEKKVIYPLCEDLEKCQMIRLVLQEDGRPFRKVKQHGYVMGYEFTWSLSLHPAVATAKEVKKIQERVDKNPNVLKVAKNLIQGEKKPRKKKNFDLERDYDFDVLEDELLKKQKARNKKRN